MAMLLAVIAVLSCSEEDGGLVSVSVPGESLAVSADLNDVTFNVQSDGEWTVKALSQNYGLEVSWVRLGMSKGMGNMTVPVRVLPNPYSTERTVKLTVISKIGQEAVLELVQAANGDPSAEEDLTIRVGNYNIRVVTSADRLENAWENRSPRLIQSIGACDFDIFGVNEWSTTSQTYLQEQLHETYNFKIFSPYAQTGAGNNAMGICYKKGFTLIDWHYFWLSDTPDIMASGNDGGKYNRGGCCGMFVHNDTDTKFFFMVAHGPLNDSLRDGKAHVLVDQEKRYNPDGYPSFFVGDLNALEYHQCSAVYREHWSDTYLVLDDACKNGIRSTYNAFDLNRNMATNDKRLDYIYFRGGATPLNYVADDQKYAGYYASDHLPIYSDMALSLKTEPTSF